MTFGFKSIPTLPTMAVVYTHRIRFIVPEHLVPDAMQSLASGAQLWYAEGCTFPLREYLSDALDADGIPNLIVYPE